MRKICHLSFFLAQELVDELVRHHGSVAAGKVSDAFQPSATLCVAFEFVAFRNEPGQTRRLLSHLHHHHHTGSNKMRCPFFFVYPLVGRTHEAHGCSRRS